jgi:hypothetical protein
LLTSAGTAGASGLLVAATSSTPAVDTSIPMLASHVGSVSAMVGNSFGDVDVLVDQ